MKKVITAVILATFGFFILFWTAGIYLTDNFVESQIEDLFESASEVNSHDFDSLRFDHLPIPVTNYFSFSILNRAALPKTAKISQKAFYRTEQNAEFKELNAVQYYSLSPPGFIWDAEFSNSGLLSMRSIDSYFNGEGNIQIKLLGGITVTDQTGEHIDRSMLSRWLSESVLFPTALLPRDSLKWSQIDSTTSAVQFTDNGITVSAEVKFNKDGSIASLKSEDRVFYTRSGYRDAVNITHYSDYKVFENFRVPTKLKIEWIYDDQKIEFAKIEIINIQYDNNLKEQ